jgi:hypothetical protein
LISAKEPITKARGAVADISAAKAQPQLQGPLDGPLKHCLLQLPSAKDKMSDAIITKLAGALAASREVDTRKGTSTIDTAALKTLEATIAVRLAHMSDEQRAKVINTAIDILRANNTGPEAEAEVRRILGV